MRKDTIKQAYLKQKSKAKTRNIEFQFTFEEWVTWWGTDIVNRGNRKGKLCMARFNDTGAYHPNNVRKATHEENVIEGHKGKTWTAEQKAKQSQLWTAEQKAKTSERMKQYWAMRNSTKELN